MSITILYLKIHTKGTKVKDILYLSQILEIFRNKINFIKFALHID